MVFLIPIVLCILQSSCIFSVWPDPLDGVDADITVTIIPMPFCRWRNQRSSTPFSMSHCFCSFYAAQIPLHQPTQVTSESSSLGCWWKVGAETGASSVHKAFLSQQSRPLSFPANCKPAVFWGIGTVSWCFPEKKTLLNKRLKVQKRKTSCWTINVLLCVCSVVSDSLWPHGL